MKTNKIFFIVIFFINTNLFSQSFEDQVKAISENIESIKREEKNALKKGIETLDSQVNNKTISIEEYQAQKQTLAAKHAKNIEERVMAEEQKLRELISQKVDGKVVETMAEIQLKKDSLIVKYKKTSKENGEWYYNQKKNNTIINQNYTETGFLFAMGINNLIDNNNFN